MSYTGNSNASKNRGMPEQERKKVEKVISDSSKVKIKNESEFGKLKRQFITEDSRSVKGHVVSEVVIPGLQRLFTDIVKSGVDWLVYGIKGNGGNYNTRYNTRGGNVSYSNRQDNFRGMPRDVGRGNNNVRNTIYSIDEIVFDERGEAEVVLEHMLDMIDTYGSVSVSDFYDLIGQRGNHTDIKWGWDNLDISTVERRGSGYFIRLPRATPLN